MFLNDGAHFDGSGSYDPWGYGITEYKWKCGDGTTHTETAVGASTFGRAPLARTGLRAGDVRLARPPGARPTAAVYAFARSAMKPSSPAMDSSGWRLMNCWM